MAIKKMVSEDAVVPETLQGETVKIATIGGKDINAPKGGGGGGTDANAVHYTAETRTADEKAQARQNTGAAAAADLAAHAENEDIHVTVEEKAAWDAKAEVSDIPELAAPAEDATDEQAAKAKSVYDWVNSTINSLAAFYITKNAAKDAFATKTELFAATVFYNSGVARTPTRNDYAIVLADETHGGACTRWSFQGVWGEGGGWEYQYTVNETALTQAQLDAINSGITAALVALIPTAAKQAEWEGKQDALTGLTQALVTWLTQFKGADTATTVTALNAAIVAKYAKPSGGIPASDLASGVIPEVRYALATSSSATMADRMVNLLTMTQSETLVFPTSITGKARDFLLKLNYTAGTLTLPTGVTKVGDELTFTAGKTYLITFTEIAANQFYVRAIGIA